MADFRDPKRRPNTVSRDRDLRKRKRRAKKNWGRYSLKELDRAFHDSAAWQRRMLDG